MNTVLTDENYEALSRYRQERAHETLAEIPYLREQGGVAFRLTALNNFEVLCHLCALLIGLSYKITKYLRIMITFVRIFMKHSILALLLSLAATPGLTQITASNKYLYFPP